MKDEFLAASIECPHCWTGSLFPEGIIKQKANFLLLRGEDGDRGSEWVGIQGKESED